MIKREYVNTLRLKFKGRMVSVKVAYFENKISEIKVDAPVVGQEKASFEKSVFIINSLIKKDIDSKTTILQKLDRLINVDNDVLLFMKNVVSRLFR